MTFKPSRVALFSGLMVDRPGQGRRLPPEKVDVAGRAIGGALDRLGMATGDVGLCGGANGGDLLFAENCLERGAFVEVRIPFPVSEFLPNSVSFAGPDWEARFAAVTGARRSRLLIMPQELEDVPDGINPYERNNLWLLSATLGYGAEHVQFIALWDGGSGAGPGGTGQMFEAVQKMGIDTVVIDPARLGKATTEEP